MRPLTFAPILKQTIWGGNKIILLKHLDAGIGSVGESWELSAVGGNESRVAGGEHDGRTLGSLVEEYKGELVGESVYRRFGNTFPLLVKFIDARDDLSIQVHPDDATARRRGLPRGKTEMWYVMDSEPYAKILIGLRERLTPEEYAARVAAKTIVSAIRDYAVRAGDCFFVSAGMIHGICRGTLLAEIQQTSDTTYRIYDYDRRDKDGKPRQLHTAEAAEAIDYTVRDDYRTHYEGKKNCAETLVTCPYFHTVRYDIDKSLDIDYTATDSFVALVCVAGKAILTTDDGGQHVLTAGHTLLLPASTRHVTVDGTVTFLETTVPEEDM